MNNNNSGSTVIEISLIMPIIISIIISIVFLFLDIINDAIIQGYGYCSIYAISNGESEAGIEDRLYDDLNEKIVGTGNMPDANVKSEKGELSVYINNSKNKDVNLYIYQGESVCYKREIDKCTQRLRRWQLYGDVLRE